MNFVNTLYFKVLSTTTKLANQGESVDSILGDDAGKIEKIANTALNIVMWAGLTIFVVLLAVAGVKIMISNQNGEENQKTKQGIKSLILGACICGFASLISVVVKAFVNFQY